MDILINFAFKWEFPNVLGIIFCHTKTVSSFYKKTCFPSLCNFGSIVKLGCYQVVWWRLWNFSWDQMKFNTFLYPNKHTQRIFWYLVTWFDCEPSKIGHFQSSKSNFKAKFNLIFLKMIFWFEYQFRWTFFINSF